MGGNSTCSVALGDVRVGIILSLRLHGFQEPGLADQRLDNSRPLGGLKNNLNAQIRPPGQQETHVMQLLLPIG